MLQNTQKTTNSKRQLTVSNKMKNASSS